MPKATPSAKPLSKKIFVKEGYKVLAVSPPSDYAALLGVVPDGVTIATGKAKGPVDLAHLWVKSRAELAKAWPALKKALSDETILWISYPKKGGAIKTDLSRDEGWEPVTGDGWEGCSLVAVDDTWSAMRFRRA